MEENLYTLNYTKIIGVIGVILIIVLELITSKLGGGMKDFIIALGRKCIDFVSGLLFAIVLIFGLVYLFDKETLWIGIAIIIGGFLIVSFSLYFLYIIIDISDSLYKLVKLKENENKSVFEENKEQLKNNA